LELTNVSDKNSLNEFNEVARRYREFNAGKVPKIKKGRWRKDELRTQSEEDQKRLGDRISVFRAPSVTFIRERVKESVFRKDQKK